MFKDNNRLDLRVIKETDEMISKIYQNIKNEKIELAKTNIIKLLSTPDFFIREYVGRKFVDCPDDDKMQEIINELVDHKVYGVRAATIFYYYIKYDNNPEKIFDLLDKSWNDTPWETEFILHEMWQKHPDIMKEKMKIWAESDFIKQKTIAYHGIETIANSDPIYVLKLVEKNLDEQNIDLQKKISNILSHVVKARAAEAYAYFREWLTKPSESRNKTLFLAMKKLVSIACSPKSNKTDDFYILTMQAIQDWKVDPVKSVSSTGEKLVSFAKNPIFTDSE